MVQDEGYTAGPKGQEVTFRHPVVSWNIPCAQHENQYDVSEGCWVQRMRPNAFGCLDLD